MAAAIMAMDPAWRLTQNPIVLLSYAIDKAIGAVSDARAAFWTEVAWTIIGGVNSPFLVGGLDYERLYAKYGPFSRGT